MMQQSSWKDSQTHDLHSRPERGQGELQLLQHIRKSQNIYIVTAVFEHQCDLFRKRPSLIWSRIQDITSSFIHSRIWHYTIASSLYSAKNLSLEQAMKKKCQKRNINTSKYFHLLLAMVAEGSKSIDYNMTSHHTKACTSSCRNLLCRITCIDLELSSTNHEQHVL